jgi:hypothetical protein
LRYRGAEAETTFHDGVQDAGRLGLTECTPHLENHLGERRLLDSRVGPERLHELQLGDKALGAKRKIDEGLEHLRLHLDELAVTLQRALARIELEVEEEEQERWGLNHDFVVMSGHGSSGLRRTDMFPSCTSASH